MAHSIKETLFQKRNLTEDEEDALVAFERKDEPEVPGDPVLRRNVYALALRIQKIRGQGVQKPARKRQS
jgi:hypothetical protein